MTSGCAVPDFETTTTLMIVATFIVAGVVKGVTGMGLPTVAMGVLGLFMPPVVAAGLLILPSFITNIWQLLAGPDFKAIVSRLWPMMIAIAVGTLLGIRLMTSGTGVWTTSALGLCLAAYAAYSLLAKPFAVPARLEPKLSPAVGLATGLLTGGTGIFVVPCRALYTVAWLQPRRSRAGAWPVLHRFHRCACRRPCLSGRLPRRAHVAFRTRRPASASRHVAWSEYPPHRHSRDIQALVPNLPAIAWG